jgi:hypothetical protein
MPVGDAGVAGEILCSSLMRGRRAGILYTNPFNGILMNYKIRIVAYKKGKIEPV